MEPKFGSFESPRHLPESTGWAAVLLGRSRAEAQSRLQTAWCGDPWVCSGRALSASWSAFEIGYTASPKTKDPAGATEWQFNSRGQKQMQKAGNLAAAFHFTPVFHHKLQAPIWLCDCSSGKAEHQTQHYKSNHGRRRKCLYLAGFFKIWSFEFQL